MSKRIASLAMLAVLLLIACSAAQAQTRRYFISPGQAGNTEQSGSGAVYNTCYNVLLAIRPAGGFYIRMNGSTESASVAQAIGLPTAILGAHFDIACEGIDTTGIGNISGTGTIDIGQVCAMGATANLIMQTYIQSIDEFGRSVPAGVMPNPQCRIGCVVQRPSGGEASAGACVGYLEPGVEREVGLDIWVSCSGDGIAQTGQTCNFANADLQGVDEQAELPQDSVIDSGSSNGGNGGLSGQDSANLQAIADNTALALEETSGVRSNVAALGSVLTGLRNDMSGYETNAAARHTDAMGLFGDMKSLLQEIRDKPGNGTGPGDGYEATNGPGELPGAPNIEHPEGGLKAPGESAVDGFKSLLDNTPARAIGTCPTWTFDIEYFNRSYVMDAHCQLFETQRATVEAVMVIVWSIGALALVLRA